MNRAQRRALASKKANAKVKILGGKPSYTRGIEIVKRQKYIQNLKKEAA